MQLIPAIDIKNGACVRLLQGNFADVTVYSDDPVDIARRFGRIRPAALHIVDLDGAAAGRPVNQELVRKMVRAAGCPIQTGGGLRNTASIETVLGHGASRVVLGSMAITDPPLTTSLLSRFGADAIVLALDVRRLNGRFRVCTHGWTQDTTIELRQILNIYLPQGLRHVLITDIERDGALSGPNTDLYRDIVQEFPALAVQASGGIRDVTDLDALAECGAAAAISGKALLEKRIADEEMTPFLQSA